MTSSYGYKILTSLWYCLVERRVVRKILNECSRRPLFDYILGHLRAKFKATLTHSPNVMTAFFCACAKQILLRDYSFVCR